MRIIRGIVGLALVALVGGAAEAKEIAGNNYPESLNIAGNELKLVGVGIRKKAFLFKVYTLGVYSKSGERSRPSLTVKNEPKFLWMKMKRTITREKMGAAMDDSFRDNTTEEGFAKIKDRFEKLKSLMPAELTEGMDIGLYYEPGKGVVVSEGQTQKGVIPGRDFAIALFSVWFGKKPVDSSLMNSILED